MHHRVAADPEVACREVLAYHNANRTVCKFKGYADLHERKEGCGAFNYYMIVKSS
jgi:hypothetical protein